MWNNPSLLKGVLDTILLQTILEGATYGYMISKAIQKTTEGKMVAQEGTVYPALHRLENHGYLQSRWDGSAGKRRRKHYSLTETGRQRLNDLRSEWSEFSTSVNTILNYPYHGLSLESP